MAESAPIARYVFAKSAAQVSYHSSRCSVGLICCGCVCRLPCAPPPPPSSQATPEEDARTSIFMEQIAGNIIGPWHVSPSPLSTPILCTICITPQRQVRHAHVSDRRGTGKGQAKSSQHNQINLLRLRAMWRPLLFWRETILRRLPLVSLGPQAGCLETLPRFLRP